MSHNHIVRITADNIAQYVDRIDMHPDPLARLVEALPSGSLHFLLAETSDGNIAGHVGINPNAPTLEDTLQHISYPTPTIAFMQVAEPYRRQGIGADLLDAACQTAVTELGATSIFLSVAVHNDNARQFYANRGFNDWGHGTLIRNQFVADSTGEYPAQPTPMEMNIMIKDLPA